MGFEIYGVILIVLAISHWVCFKWGGSKYKAKLDRAIASLEARNEHDDAESEWDGAGGLGAHVGVRDRDE